jgi:ribosomal protein S18 acetylase RimI-like enzyme
LEIDQWSRENRLAGLYFLASSDCPRTIQTALRHGFDLVDVRVTFERSTKGSADLPQLVPLADLEIRPARIEDIPALQAIARTAHTDTRFFSDPHFPSTRSEALYTTWIELECTGRAQHVLVAASHAGQALGYISCHLDQTNHQGQIGLVGIDSHSRGKGLGKTLVLAALHWFTRHGADITVVTQGKNITAQRLYQKSGFLIRDLQLWFHKWYPSPVPYE